MFLLPQLLNFPFLAHSYLHTTSDFPDKLLPAKKQKTKASEREKERDRSQTDQEDCLRQWRWNPWIAGDGYVQEHSKTNLDFSKHWIRAKKKKHYHYHSFHLSSPGWL
jgi:hypothetical protein